jgi:hypothetical protein
MYAEEKEQVIEIATKYGLRKSQQCSANQLLSGLKKRIPSADGKSVCGFIAIFDYLIVLGRISSCTYLKTKFRHRLSVGL